MGLLSDLTWLFPLGHRGAAFKGEKELLFPILSVLWRHSVQEMDSCYPRWITCFSAAVQYSFSAAQWLWRGGERSGQENTHPLHFCEPRLQLGWCRLNDVCRLQSPESLVLSSWLREEGPVL